MTAQLAMKVTGYENRRPREFFTKALARICEGLDKKSSAVIAWDYPFLQRSGETLTTVKNLWAFGSYGRGAPACGDLDIVVEVDTVHVTASNIWRPLLGGLNDVRTYLGVPDDNTSGVELTDAKLIWSGPGCDWKAAIENIKEDPSTQRFHRATDAIPFRLEQLCMPHEVAEDLVEQEQAGHIRWSFQPMRSDALEQALTSEQALLHADISRRFSTPVKSDKALHNAILELASSGVDITPGATSTSDSTGKCGPAVGGTVIHLGKKQLDIGLLDSLRVDKIMVAPVFSARGPNGVWTIERGDNHPLVKAVEDVTIFAEFKNDGPVYGMYGFRNGRPETLACELYGSIKEAIKDLSQFDDYEIGEIRQLSGREILHHIAGCAVVHTKKNTLPITMEGSWETQEPLLKSDEVLSKIRSALKKRRLQP